MRTFNAGKKKEKRRSYGDEWQREGDLGEIT